MISRIANTITTDTLDEVEVKLEGYTLDYLNQYIEENIIEGRLPKSEQEVVVSAYLLKYLDFEIVWL